MGILKIIYWFCFTLFCKIYRGSLETKETTCVTL